jgi:signal transduction histidine kinase
VGPAIFVALTAGGQPFGTLMVGRPLGAPVFSDPDVQMVRSFAAQASVVLDSARQRQRLLRMSLLEDQERIARDLHDTVIQQVFAVGLSLQGVMSRIADHQVQGRISAAVDELDGVIRRIRAVIFNVAPPAASAQGLRREFLGVAQEAGRMLGFEPAVTFEGPVDTVIGQEASSHAVAIVREALSNVTRHAQATQVEILVTVDDERLTIRVIDDGVGVPSDADESGGHGLRNMRERAERLGGHFQVSSRPQERGTAIEWALPLT